MDTVGLLAAWVAILSFLGGILLVIFASFAGRRIRQWWAMTSKERAARRLRALASDLKCYSEPVDNWHVVGLISLYGSMIMTLIASIGLMIVSIQILDLGPALLAATMPFYINAKLITRVTGLLMLGISYLFILRLSYLWVKLKRKYVRNKVEYLKATEMEIFKLRSRFDLQAESPERRDAALL
jgi:hypothetical protein